ncbi:MAG: sulfite exporter TauE/SafE family protein [Betaproteobacteria bacterium]|nr:MAG: sulfite exporter TauE/SafE family protein [Betaproteobacteria bacterium]
MDALTTPELLYFCFIIVISYAIRGSAGFGGITVPLLAWVISLKTVVPMVTLLGLVSSAAILRTDYRHVAWRDLRRILPWTALGVAIGVYFFKILDANTLARILGGVVLGYGGYALLATWRPPGKVKLPMAAIMPTAGTLAGFVGTMFGSMAGMFFAIYLDILRYSRDVFRATVAAILFGLGILRGGAYVATGEFTRDVLVACAIALPMMALGIFIGDRVHANLNDIAFKRLVAVILIISGLPLLIR